MAPQPFSRNDPPEYDDDPLAPARGIFNAVVCMIVIIACVAGAIWIWTGIARAHAPRPIPAPLSLTRAREACPNTATIVECRGELRKAYAAIDWQKKQSLEIAREMVGNVTAWKCIHGGEGSWTANTGNGYHGGLQMDRSFMLTYGRDMLRRHGGAGAEAWTPREQIIVAQRAFVQGRGYAPWPNTSRACGLRS